MKGRLIPRIVDGGLPGSSGDRREIYTRVFWLPGLVDTDRKDNGKMNIFGSLLNLFQISFGWLIKLYGISSSPFYLVAFGRYITRPFIDSWARVSSVGSP